MNAKSKSLYLLVLTASVGVAALLWGWLGRVEDSTASAGDNFREFGSTTTRNSGSLEKEEGVQEDLKNPRGEEDLARKLPIVLPKLYALSPGPRSLGDAVQDASSGKDPLRALELAHILNECRQLETKEAMIDLERTNPSSLANVTADRVKNQSAQLVQSRAECQTVAGDVKALQLRLAEIALEGGAPGAALLVAQARSGGTNTDSLPSGLLDKIAADARKGELRSLVASIVDNAAPVSNTERLEMALALEVTARKFNPLASDIGVMFGAVAHYFWNNGDLRGTADVPRGEQEVFVFDKLPPRITMPTDPAAIARISKLTEQLATQIQRQERARELAQRRLAGG